MTRTTPRRPADVEALFPELARYRRTATRLHPRPGTPGVRDSSVGGPLLWPAAEPWPMCIEPHKRRSGERVRDVRLRRRILAEAWSRTPAPGERPGPTDEERAVLDTLKRGRHAPWLGRTDPIPMAAVAQLYRRDIPDLVGGPADCDLLQVFWCPFDAHGGGHDMSLHLRWRRSADVRQVREEQPEPVVVGHDGYVPEPCVLHPERVVEYEYIEQLPDGLARRIAEWEGPEDDWEPDTITYESDLSIAPGWKVGGFASWHTTGPATITCGPCGRALEPLLTVASSEWDGGTGSWTPLEDRPAADAMDANTPTHVTVGRWGSLFILTCPAYPEHPHHLVIQ
ncbi:hypothetical protein [Streptomyces sp. NPDC006784]|uniref:hypothetical protein n=1 Tax=Streptomyces sp. NPDC006784 TaxID=3364764 RepID=UPI0036ACBB31